MTPDELQQQEELGRKIAAALAPLGLPPGVIQSAALHMGKDCALTSSERCRSSAVFRAHLGWYAEEDLFSLAAGVAAYFEEQGK